jgi:hypothetical protein
MRSDKYRPCELADVDDSSLLTEPVVDIAPRRSRPFRAIMLDAMVHSQALLTHLERVGVPAPSAEERSLIRELYLRTREQAELLRQSLDLLAADR